MQPIELASITMQTATSAIAAPQRIPGELSLSWVGIILAVLFATALIWMMWWMLHPPAQVSAAVAKARRSIDAIKRILVPTLGMPYSERGVELACRLGAEQTAEIVLAYVLEVPRTLPLGAEMPREEEKAQEALARAESIVSLRGLPAICKLERAREAAEEIIRAAKEYDVDMIVMGVRPRLNPAHAVLGRTPDILLRRAPCEVIIDRPQQEQ